MEKELEKNKKSKEDNFKVRCNKCNSTLGYYRLKDKMWICRSCGNVEALISG